MSKKSKTNMKPTNRFRKLQNATIRDKRIRRFCLWIIIGALIWRWNV